MKKGYAAFLKESLAKNFSCTHSLIECLRKASKNALGSRGPPRSCSSALPRYPNDRLPKTAPLTTSLALLHGKRRNLCTAISLALLHRKMQRRLCYDVLGFTAHKCSTILTSKGESKACSRLGKPLLKKATLPTKESALEKVCRNPQTPSQSPDGDSSPEGRA